MSFEKRKSKLSNLDRSIGSNQAFVAVRKDFLKSQCYQSLSFSAKALYMDLCAQYKPPTKSSSGNNGNLTLGQAYMRDKFGWASSATLTKAKKELLNHKIIIISRPQRWKRDVILYALSTYSIDYCPDSKGANKHDLKHTSIPLDIWKEWQAN